MCSSRDRARSPAGSPEVSRMMRVADSSARSPDHGGQRQAGRIGHAGVEQHQRVRPARGDAVPEGIHGRRPVAHRGRLHLPAAQPLLQDVAVGGVVIDDEHRAGSRSTGRRSSGDRLRGGAAAARTAP